MPIGHGEVDFGGTVEHGGVTGGFCMRWLGVYRIMFLGTPNSVRYVTNEQLDRLAI